MRASGADSRAVRAWTPPEPLGEGEDSGYEPEWYDEGGGPVTEPERRWAGELISPFAAEAAAVPDGEEEQPGPFSVEGELLVWATELAQAPHQVRAAFGRQADTEAVGLLVGHGVRDEEWLTDLVFHARHRELAGRPPGPDEPALANERQAIRDDEIRPRLEGEEENFLGDIVRDGLARNAVRAALAGGEQNENKLTDLGYRAIPGVPAQIKADDPRFAELKQRWTRVRDRIVRPLLREKKAGLDRLVPRSRPGLRPCCVIFGTELLDLGSLGSHGPAAGEPLGEVYTRKLGFVDLGHARETADVTLWALTQLRQNASTGTVIDLYHGSARLLREVPVERRLALAQQLTYVDSVEHEIVTFGTIQDYSAFSPEDLPSNLFGTLVAAAAFRADGGSDAAITQQFKQLLTAAEAQPVAVARQVQVAALLRGWWATSPAIALRKRNFTAVPWLINENGNARIGHGALAAAPALVSADFEYTSGNNGLKNSEFAQKIAVIRAAVPASAVTP
ncbi:DUF4056 domain-containing protein [Amycolatopsis sp. NPDC051758]|uniref:DUF4056 domain-containing protein n=1 Tax=Amycolatopsis sp. NPDC051758 TaxID=3363935 RepID=UPI00379D37DA